MRALCGSHFGRRCVVLVAGLLAWGGSGASAQSEPKQEVVVYTSLDRQFSEPILEMFERRTGIDVKPVYDTEAVKTVGLVNRLLAERKQPRCDVFWNNEVLRSIQLKREGLTESYESPSAKEIPAAVKDPDGHWTGFAARARIFAVNTKRLPNETEWPTAVADLASPKWKGKAAFAKPLFGTTNTHAATMWAMAGEETTTTFWKGAFDNSVMEAGNAQACNSAAAGAVDWAFTDTDDAYGAIQDGAPIRIVYPTTDIAGDGVLLIPNTVVLLKNSPNQDNGRKLIDFLLSEEVEGALAKSRSAQIPVRENVAPPVGLEPLPADRVLAVDWEKVAESIAPASQWLQNELNTR